MTPYRFLLAGNGSYLNRGCEAIVRGTTAILRREFGECSLISAYLQEPGCEDARCERDPAITHVPIQRVRRGNMQWIRRHACRLLRGERDDAFLWRPLRSQVEASAAVLMVGGDNYSLEYGTLDRCLAFNRLVHEWRRPVLLWGASVGPFSAAPAVEQRAAEVLARAELICVRETVSRDYLAGLGLVDNVVLAADPAFWLEPRKPVLPAAIEDALAVGAVGLNLSPLLLKFGGWANVEEWVRAAGAIARQVVAAVDAPVVLVPHVTSLRGQDVRADDFAFMARVRDAAGVPAERLLLLGPDYDAAETKWVIARLRAFAGARTHSTLAALSSAVPTVIIAYSAKAKGICRDIYGEQRWFVDAGELFTAGEKLAERVGALVAEESAVRTVLQGKAAKLKASAATAAQALRRVIEGGTARPTPGGDE